MSATKPFKLTEDRIDRICEAIAKGATREVAALWGGISDTAYYRYMERARNILAEGREPENEDERMLVKLHDDLQIAEVDAELSLLDDITKAGKNGDWRASAHILARRWPDRWADRSKLGLEVSGPNGGPVELEGGVLSVLAKHAVPAEDDGPS